MVFQEFPCLKPGKSKTKFVMMDSVYMEMKKMEVTDELCSLYLKEPSEARIIWHVLRQIGE